MMINLEFDGDLPSPAAVLLMVLNSDETRGQLPPNVEWVHAYANHWATKLLWQPAALRCMKLPQRLMVASLPHVSQLWRA